MSPIINGECLQCCLFISYLYILVNIYGHLIVIDDLISLLKQATVCTPKMDPIILDSKQGEPLVLKL